MSLKNRVEKQLNSFSSLSLFVNLFVKSFYLKKFKASKPDAQVVWVKLFHNAEQVIILLTIMHWHQVCTRVFFHTAELDMKQEEHLMTSQYSDLFEWWRK